jgi:hypothetical protein
MTQGKEQGKNTCGCYRAHKSRGCGRGKPKVFHVIFADLFPVLPEHLHLLRVPGLDLGPADRSCQTGEDGESITSTQCLIRVGAASADSDLLPWARCIHPLNTE